MVALFSKNGPAVRNQVYEHLRNQINCMQLEPGSRLVTSEIANRLNVQHSQVREAILMLVDEGLIELCEGRYHVIRFDLHFVGTMCSFRRMVERETIQECSRHAAREDLERLRQRWMEFRTHEVQPDRIETFFEADLYFHRCLGELSMNRYLKQCLDRLLVVDLLIQRWSYHMGALASNHVEHSVATYLAVLDALLSGDAQVAGDTLDTHLKRTHERIVAMVETSRPKIGSL